MTEPVGEPLTYIHPVALPETEFIFAANCLRKWRVYHESYVVCVCAQASADWRYRGRTQQLRDACYMLMEPGETHVNVVVPRPQTYKVLRISGAVIEQLADELRVPRTPHFALTQDGNPAIIRAFEQLATAVSADSTVLEQQSRFASCLRLVLENCSERARPSTIRDSSTQRAPVERAKMYLRERFSAPVSLNELAKAAGLSRFHLLRSFAKQVGMPPHTYQVRLRVERACLLMQAGVAPSNAATAAGFADQSHFTRHFRKVMDITPGRYAHARVRCV
jgi:AraC-like DNA-binding protein